MDRQWLTLRVSRIRQEATGILSYELTDPRGVSLPAFAAGAHVEVEIHSGLSRHYSLCNHPEDQSRYLIAVLRDPGSRGGSQRLHEKVREGDLLKVSEPRNHFPLAAGAHSSLLLAGGIGVTPLLCMAERLSHAGADFRLHYCGRSLARMAFVSRIQHASFADRVTFHVDDAPDYDPLDLDVSIGEPRPGLHLYVCGPTGYMDWILSYASRRGWPEGQVHREFFAAPALPVSATHEFQVQLASNGKTYTIGPDVSITTVLAEDGINIPTSCQEGVCGTCLTRIIAGEPDHRDAFLSAEERAANDQILPCCSRAKSATLVLDI